MYRRQVMRRTVLWIVALLSLAWILPGITTLPANAAAQQNRRIDRFLKRYRRFDIEPAAAARRARTTGELSIPTEDGTLQLSLEPNDIRSPRYRAEAVQEDGITRPVSPEQIRTFRGTIPGVAGSEARFTIHEGSLEGIVLTPASWYLVEPMRHYDPSSPNTAMVAYRASDIIPESFGTCGTALAEQIGDQIFRIQETITPQALEASSSLAVADVATEADYEYVTANGGAAGANNAILDIMNQIDGIYRVQLSISLRVAYQHSWETPSDPYTSTASSTMLDEFRSYWISHFSSVPFDLAHLWTGKDMDGSTIGIAYLGVACHDRSYSYGVSQRYAAAPAKYILTAHEIGHNFGANHTEQASPPQADCSNTIMNSSVGTGTSFCAYSRAEIERHVSQYSSCLAAATGNCDVNKDSQMNALDLQSLANAVLGIAACPGNCDSNRDGSVNALDVQLEANVILGTAACP